MKIAVALAGAALLGTTLAACGGDDGGGGGGNEADYCKELKTAQSSFAKIASSDFAELDSAVETFHQLADDAPSDIQAEWKTLDGTFVKVEKALEEAGIKLSDLADIRAGQTPEGLDVSKLTSLASSLREISSAKVTEAQETITTHAKDVCSVDLGAS